MCVDYVVAVDSGLITVYLFLTDGVGDLGTLFESGKAFKCPLPAVACGNILCTLYAFIVGYGDGDGVGTLAVVIVIVVPCLFAGNGNLFRLVGVCDNVTCGHIAGNFGSVTVNGSFLYGILDLGAAVILEKSLKGVRPAVCFRESKGIARLCAVGKKLNGNAVGAFAVVIVGVVPYLGNIYRYLGRYYLVCDGRSVGLLGAFVVIAYSDHRPVGGLVEGNCISAYSQSAACTVTADKIGIAYAYACGFCNYFSFRL